MNEWKKINEKKWMKKWVKEWMKEKMNERMNERKKGGVVWIVDLKGKTRKKRWVLPSCGFKSV